MYKYHAEINIREIRVLVFCFPATGKLVLGVGIESVTATIKVFVFCYNG